MSKQTALQWYRHQIWLYLTGDSETQPMPEGQIFARALEMEREQIEDAYCNGVIDGAGEVLNRDTIKPDAVKYYEDNHGKEAQP